MIEVELHRDADRQAVVQALRKIGAVYQRDKVKSVISVDADIGNIPEINRITGVVYAEDGDELTGEGFSQTHTLSKPLRPYPGTAYLFALHSFGIMTNRIGYDLKFEDDYEILLDPDKTGDGVVIGIVDNLLSNTGHTEFAGRYSGTPIYNGYSGSAALSHANWVGSCAAGASYGVAPGATLVNARGLNENNQGSTTILINAMDAIANAHDANPEQYVCNCSFGGSSTSYNAAATDLADSGVPVIAAAGNNGVDLQFSAVYPAMSPDTITVGGLDLDNNRDPNSNYGNSVDIYTGYGPHWAVNLDGNFENVWGTSFSAPLVSGHAARLLEGRTKMTNLQQCREFNYELLGYSRRDAAGSGGSPLPQYKRLVMPLRRDEYQITRSS